MDYYSNRKKKKKSFNNIRPNIYNHRVDNNVTKQFREIHKSENQTIHYPKAETDESGLDKAYASSDHLHLDDEGTLYVSGTKGGLLGKEWIENYQSFGVPLVKKILDLDLLAPTTYDVTQMDRYKQLDQFIKDNPDKVKNFVAHSKGSAVVDQWMKNNPDFKGKARLYSTPYDDPLGKEKIKDMLNDSRKQRHDYFKDKSWIEKVGNSIQDKEQDLLEHITGFDEITGMKERGQTRIANNQDFAAVLDSSADRYDHPNPFAYLRQGGPHDYHEGIAQFKSGFDKPETERPGEEDPNYRTLQ
jgi:hypothetical protein